MLFFLLALEQFLLFTVTKLIIDLVNDVLIKLSVDIVNYEILYGDFTSNSCKESWLCTSRLKCVISMPNLLIVVNLSASCL